MPTSDRVDPKTRARELLEARGNVSADLIEDVKRLLLGDARQGDAESQTLLGAVELEVAHDPEGARPWFELAAAQGGAAAQRSLGYLYATGQGVQIDKDKAVELYRKSADLGDPFAMFNLAMENVGSGGTYLSFGEMLELLRASAEHGIPEAAAKLGDLLSSVDRDQEAAQAYVKAADLGHTGAMYALGCWARDGIVGVADNVEAVRWYLTMMGAGDGNGIHHAIELGRHMTDGEIRQAAGRAGRPELAGPLIQAARSE